jgi:hypothetical protein
MSVSNSRCSGQKRNGTGNPTRQDGKTDSTESTRVPDQQVPPRRTGRVALWFSS